MPDTPTPGEVAYAAYCAGLTWRLPWQDIPARQQQRWEAAAQAVLEACAMLCPICGAELECCNARETP